ncbi:hypothetical protein TNCV_4844921 [Trichonephila clavipes]|uniref:Uncharacterized protein n=1 Tax=Trichonephila clavipes TaxID=2585209 RepID=A0A8X7BLZ8_TRICX|nr:hypothetical protein TNCV_4844921 [Trichonephila clavipes]
MGRWSLPMSCKTVHLKKGKMSELTIDTSKASSALAEQNGVAFTPWVALPGVDTPDVHRPLRPGTPPRHFEAACRT